jgi:ferredoxin
MFKLTILPNNEIIEVSGAETLLATLKTYGYEMKSSCGGCASCGDCVIKIKEGEKNLSDSTFEERRLLGSVFHITKERLSCQTRINGAVTIDLSSHPGKAIKEKSTILLKKKEIVSVQEATPVQGSPEWFKHWEKNEDQKSIKKLGGNKRPKPFKYNPNENDEN